MFQIGKLFRKISYWELIILSFVICLCIWILCFRYYQYLRETIYEESSDYLDEISKQNSANVHRIIEDYYTYLDLLSNLLTAQSFDTINDVQSLIHKQKEYLHYQDVLLIDSSGIGYRENGQTIPLSGDTYIRDTLLNKEQSLSSLQAIDQKESVILAVPVENVILDGKNIVALAVSFNTEEFERVVSITSFDETVHSYIINQEGNSILGTSSLNTLFTSNNLLEII